MKQSKGILPETAQENTWQKNERCWTDEQNAALSCEITRQWRSVGKLSPDRNRGRPPHPSKEVVIAVQSLKKGESAGVYNVPAELVQEGGEEVDTALTTICSKIWQKGERKTPWTQSLVITLPKNGNLQQSQKLPNDQSHQPSKQSHAEDYTEQIEAASGEDHRWWKGSL